MSKKVEKLGLGLRTNDNSPNMFLSLVGAIAGPMLEGIKADSEKSKWDLLPLEALEPVVKVLTFGAHKYERDNWKKLSDPYRRFYSAMMRHLRDWNSGKKKDPDSKLSHLAHAGCNLIFMLWFEVQDELKEKEEREKLEKEKLKADEEDRKGNFKVPSKVHSSRRGKRKSSRKSSKYVRRERLENKDNKNSK